MRFVSREEYEGALNTIYDAIESGQIDPMLRETDRATFLERKLNAFKDGDVVRDELLAQIKADRNAALGLLAQIKDAKERLAQIEAAASASLAAPDFSDYNDVDPFEDDEDGDRRP